MTVKELIILCFLGLVFSIVISIVIEYLHCVILNKKEKKKIDDEIEKTRLIITKLETQDFTGWDSYAVIYNKHKINLLQKDIKELQEFRKVYKGGNYESVMFYPQKHKSI